MRYECPYCVSSFVISVNGPKHQTIKEKIIMSTPTKSPEYLLLFRGNDWYKGLSPEEMQGVASKWMAWFKRLMDEGICLAGQPLEREGKTVSGKNGRVVSDGPFAESKEAVGG